MTKSIIKKYKWVIICEKWIEKNGKILTKRNDTILIDNHNINIGNFITSIKQGRNKILKPEIEKLFGFEIKTIKRMIKDDEWIIICKYCIKLYGKILPRQKDIINYDNEEYCIGSFINRLKEGYNKDLKPEIEELFECKIESLYKVY